MTSQLGSRKMSSPDGSVERVRSKEELQIQGFQASSLEDASAPLDLRGVGVRTSGSCSGWMCCSGIKCCTKTVIVIVRNDARGHAVFATRKVGKRAIAAQQDKFPKYSQAFFYALSARYKRSLSYIFPVTVRYLDEPYRSFWATWIMHPLEMTEALESEYVAELLRVLEVAKRLYDEMRDKKTRDDFQRIITSHSPGRSSSSSPPRFFASPNVAIASRTVGSDMAVPVSEPLAVRRSVSAELEPADLVDKVQRLNLGGASADVPTRITSVRARALKWPPKRESDDEDQASLVNLLDTQGMPYVRPPFLDADFERRRLELESRPLVFKVKVDASNVVDFSLDILTRDILATFECTDEMAVDLACRVRDEVRLRYLGDGTVVESQAIYDALAMIAIERNLVVREGERDCALDQCVSRLQSHQEAIAAAKKVDDISMDAFIALMTESNRAPVDSSRKAKKKQKTRTAVVT